MIYLSEFELKAARRLGIDRQEYDEIHASGAKNMSDVSLEENTGRSIAGELAFCKLWNIYPDLQHTKPEPYDCMLKGYKIDIKAVQNDYRQYMVTPTPRKRIDPPDYYAFISARKDEWNPWEFMGFMSHTELFDEKLFRKKGDYRFPNAKGDVYLAHAHKLIKHLPPTMNLELFNTDEVDSPSPKKQWLKRHGITAAKRLAPRDCPYPWEAWVGSHSIAIDEAMNYCRIHDGCDDPIDTPTFCCGWNEEEALWRIANQLKIKLWNEE